MPKLSRETIKARYHQVGSYVHHIRRRNGLNEWQILPKDFTVEEYFDQFKAISERPSGVYILASEFTKYIQHLTDGEKERLVNLCNRHEADKFGWGDWNPPCAV